MRSRPVVRLRAPSAPRRMPVLRFTDIGTVGYSKGAHVDDAGQKVRELAPFVKPIPVVGQVIAAALGVVASVGETLSAVFASGNAAGLSQQQLDTLADPPPSLRTYSAGERLAIVEGKAGTKILRTPSGLDVVVGGTRTGGPGRLRTRLDEL